MELAEEAVRILGCLIEKQRTTPDQYPLTTNSLKLACNQKTNRVPLSDYSETEIDQMILEMRQERLVRTVTGGRSPKHKHVLDEEWRLSDAELSVLSVMMVRGPQTVPELLSRTARLHEFESTEAIDRVLERLADRGEALVTNIGRGSGQREDRWAHLLCGTEAVPDPSEFADVVASTGGGGSRSSARVDELTAEVEALRDRVDELETRLEKVATEFGL